MAREQQMDDLLRPARRRSSRRIRNDVNGWLLLGRSYGAMGTLSRARSMPSRQAYDLIAGRERRGDHRPRRSAGDDRRGVADRSRRAAVRCRARQGAEPSEGAVVRQHRGAAGRRSAQRTRSSAAAAGAESAGGTAQRAGAADPGSRISSSAKQGRVRLPPRHGSEGAAASGSSARFGSPFRSRRSVREQLQGGPLPLFILARDPAAGGPPLAVQRHSSSDLPLTVELSERDAMIADADHCERAARAGRRAPVAIGHAAGAKRRFLWRGRVRFRARTAGTRAAVIIDRIDHHRPRTLT